MTVMLKRPLPLTVLKYRRDRLLAQRARERLKRGPHSAASLAAELNLSLRTLYRQLHEEGASLQALKDEARRDKALDLLRRTEKSIKQIAQAVGFQSERVSPAPSNHGPDMRRRPTGRARIPKSPGRRPIASRGVKPR